MPPLPVNESAPAPRQQEAPSTIPPLNRLRALARNVFVQAWRAKVWLMVVVYAIIVLLITQLAPTPVTGPEDKVKLAISVCIGTMTIFATLLAVFLAGTHLPWDIENKTIFMVLTKPVSRVKLLGGRLLGFCLTVAVVLGLMAPVGWGVVHLAQWQASRAGGKLVLKTKRAVYSTDWKPVTEGEEVPRKPTPEGLTWIAGGDLNLEARFRFPEADPEKLAVEGKIKGECAFLISTGALGVDTMHAQLIVTNPRNGKQHRQMIRLLTETPAEFSFPADLFQAGDTIQVSVSRQRLLDEGTSPEEAETLQAVARNCSFAVRSDKNLYLLKPAQPFIWNYGKALFAIGLASALMCGVAAMASTFLSGAVSVIFAFFVYFCGNVVEMIVDVAAALGKPTAGLFIWEPIVQSQTVQSPPLVQAVNTVVRNVLTGLTVVLPDFRRFSMTEQLLRSFDVSFATLGRALLDMGVYGTCAFLIAWACIRRREAEKI